MYCAHCGSPNDENSYRCTNCEEVLVRSTDEAGMEGATAPSYLAWAIVVTVFCCWPLGIPAIVYSAKTMSANSARTYDDAWKASASAKVWCWVAFGVGFVVGIGYLGLMVAGSALSTVP